MPSSVLCYSERLGAYSLWIHLRWDVFRAQHKQSTECTPSVSCCPELCCARRTKMKTQFFFAPPAARERWEPTGVVFSRMLSQHTRYWQWYYALEKSLIKVESAHWYQYCTRLIDNSTRPGLEVKDMDSQLIAMRLNWKLILLGKKRALSFINLLKGFSIGVIRGPWLIHILKMYIKLINIGSQSLHLLYRVNNKIWRRWLRLKQMKLHISLYRSK